MNTPKLKEKTWTKELEQPIYQAWKTQKVNAFKKDTRPIFSIDTPPPYVNAPVHIGQVTTYNLMDMFARYKRMQGYNVLFPLGLDRNGLPIEMAAEKEFKVKLTDIAREKALEYCNKILEKASLASVESFLRCGISFNSWDIGTGIGEIYETDSADYRAMTQETFIELFNKGLIYEDSRINNFCPGCQTTLADSEVDYLDKPTKFNDIVFKVKETKEELVIGTTRPELVCTCGMVIYHPDDERYKHLKGKTAITPIFGKEVPIKPHPLADPKKGTGLVMMCSAGDLSDIRFFREMNLTPTIAINKDGTMNELAGFLKGLKVRDAREKMLSELKEKKLLMKQVTIEHRTPICERSKDEIEFISMPEYYVRQTEVLEEMKNYAHQMNFYDDKSRQILINWIEGVTIDWPISRRRFYATEVPLWYCKKCKDVITPPKGKYYQPWKEKPPIDKCPKCGSKEFRGDERVFDTWFDSSNTPLYILKWNRDKEFFKKASPCSLRPQGKEIVRTWLYYTVLKNHLLNKSCIFRDVWVNFHILDGKGEKMSKSKGNIIDPKLVLDKYGAESFRLWIATEGNLEKIDFMCSFERIEGAGKTLTKLWNVSRFISMFDIVEEKPELLPTDKWILHELNHIVQTAKERYDRYDFHNSTVELKHFIWETLASHYLELVKSRAYNGEGKFSEPEQKSALYTLHRVLQRTLRLLAPVIPMFAYKVYQEIYGDDIHSLKFPEIGDEYKVAFETAELEDMNSKIWKAKKDAGKSLKDPITKLVISEKFKSIEQDLIVTHRIQKLEYGEELKIEL
ncbi:valine--tRNA ligase [Candidatus Woesearchaeota archaeon]|nr:valine--tRNA ligase [Candidatus Woesearchaeota archaeon]